MTVTWEEPPMTRWQSPEPRGRWCAVVDELKQHPGRWALIAENERNQDSAYKLNAGVLGGCRRGEVLATSRRNDDGSFRIWACYLGGTR